MNIKNLVNKNISTPLGVVIIVVVAVFAAGILIWQEGLILQIINSMPISASIFN